MTTLQATKKLMRRWETDELLKLSIWLHFPDLPRTKHCFQMHSKYYKLWGIINYLCLNKVYIVQKNFCFTSLDFGLLYQGEKRGERGRNFINYAT